MASIRKRGDYQWQARILRKGHSSLSKTFTTEQKAIDWARSIEGKVLAFDYVDTRHLNSITLSDLLDDMLTTAIPAKKGADQETTFVKRLKLHPIASRALTEIDEGVIRDYREDRKLTVSPTTVVKEMAMISSYYNYAISEFDKYRGLSNPVQKVRRPTPSRSRTRRYGEEEAKWIIEHSDSPMLGDVLHIALDTAMRRGEIMGQMTVENIDMEHRTIHLEDTKNGTSRTVAFSTAIVSILERRIAGRVSGRLFSEEVGAPTRAFSRALIRARKAYEVRCAKDGIEPDPKFLVNLRFHDARHEATSRLFEDHNLSIQEVASMTGHMDLKMLKRYTHMAARKIAAKLG